MIVGSTFLFQGQWRTLSEIARMTGFNRQTLQRRLDRGETLADAITPRSVLVYTFAGKTQTIRAWAEDTGISYETLRERLRQYRWPIERALTEPSIPVTERTVIARNRSLIRDIAISFRRARNQQLIHRITSAFKPAKEMHG